MTLNNEIEFRPMIEMDVDRYPIGCQGPKQEVTARIADLGASAILAFDGTRHVGQLHFRRYDPSLRSAKGVQESDYWGDFGARAPDLGDNTLAVFCYHVGQTDESDDRDPAYMGRGIGLALLDYLVTWAKDQGIDTIVAKATPAARSIMAHMGGQPVAAYRERGFEVASSWVDEEVRDMVLKEGLATPDADPADAWQISCCVKQLN